MKYNKNTFCISFLQFVFLCSFGQEIKYKCYLKSMCNKEITELKIFQLQRNSFNYFSLNGSPTAILPDTGTYVLKSSELAIAGDSILVHVGYGTNIDTIKQKDIVDKMFIDSKPSKGLPQGGGWFCCGKICNGYKTDYYNNGKKRMVGKFKNGKPVSELKFYDAIGKVKYIEYYNANGRKVK